MSTGPLFGSNIPRGTLKNLVEFKAGKMTVKGKRVYPDNRKGQLYVYQSDDSLMHLCWKDRTTGVVEDDLIIFPDDCEFKYVSQCKTGRVYLLKFKSSNRKIFFWLQDIKSDKDEENCQKINELLNNPPTLGTQRNSNSNPEGDIQNLLNNMSQQQLMQLFGGVSQIGGLGNLLGTMNRSYSSNRASTTTSTNQNAAANSNYTSSSITSSSASLTQEVFKSADSTVDLQPSGKIEQDSKSFSNQIKLSDLKSFLSRFPTKSRDRQMSEKEVTIELYALLSTAVNTDENLENIMRHYLPMGDNILTTLSSPQFFQAFSMFWSTLQSGQAALVMHQFGLGSQVVNAAASGNIQTFVNALENELKVSIVACEKKIEEPLLSSQNIISDRQENQEESHKKKGEDDDMTFD